MIEIKTRAVHMWALTALPLSRKGRTAIRMLSASHEQFTKTVCTTLWSSAMDIFGICLLQFVQHYNRERYHQGTGAKLTRDLAAF